MCASTFATTVSGTDPSAAPFRPLAGTELRRCFLSGVSLTGTAAAGRQGAWFVAGIDQPGCVIVHFDGRTAQPAGTIDLGGMCPASLVDADGVLWSLNAQAPGASFTLTRIDPATDEVISSVPAAVRIPDGNTATMAIGFGSAWVIPDYGQSGDNLNRPGIGDCSARTATCAATWGVVWGVVSRACFRTTS